MIETLSRAIIGKRVPPPTYLPAEALPSGVTLRSGRLIPWVGGVLARMGGSAAAVTLRRTIVIRPGIPVTLPLLAHELAHVQQWQNDPLFPVRYIVATLRHGYRDNPYEVEARAVARATSATQPPEETS